MLILKLLFFLYIIQSILGDIVFAPFEASATELPDLIRDGIIYDQIAILAVAAEGLFIYDIKNRSQPKL